MFYASIAKPNPDGGEEPYVFDFFLADRIGCTLGQLDAMPHTEYLGWISFHKVRQQQEELAFKRAAHA